MFETRAPLKQTTFGNESMAQEDREGVEVEIERLALTGDRWGQKRSNFRGFHLLVWQKRLANKLQVEGVGRSVAATRL